MPLVTDLFFTAITRITLWRLVTMIGAGGLVSSVALLPLWLSLPRVPPLGIAWMFVATGLLSLGAWRWRHWYKVMKANIYREG